jgi:hypothetical protein
MQWHDGLARLIERIENVWGRRCMDGDHHPRDLTEWLATGPDGAKDLDVAAGRYSPPTAPDTSQT